MGKDPKKLREQAKKLLAEAEKIENERLIKIGKLVFKYAATDFADFDLSKFKEEVVKC
ncbi:MAG: hypothetical protein AB1325_14095 [Nitrospirota bacterium]